jgi:GMP synthase (glutamine-hydrolysing)
VLAQQFHVELPERDLEKWLNGHTLELAKSNVDLAQMRADTARYAPIVNEASKKLFDDWFEGLGSASAAA